MLTDTGISSLIIILKGIAGYKVFKNKLIYIFVDFTGNTQN
jgi:hypothetical protein